MIVIPQLFRIFSSNIRKIRFMSSKIPDEVSFPRKLFSGIQPTGEIHLGNYLGAITQWVELQNNNEDMALSIVDLHALTLPQDPKELSKSILKMTATLLACGIDPNKSILFQQSHVLQHTELAWNLSCISTMARSASFNSAGSQVLTNYTLLAHLHQYKEKSATLKEIPLGLYIYPVLQTADILLYKATHVPVGDDQLQHLQLSQELARMFNRRFGVTFPLPHALVSDKGSSKIKSLRNPLQKMSKSHPDVKSRICISDSPDEIRMKLKKSVTDFTSSISFDSEARPGVSNLIRIHSSLSNKTIDEICKEAEGLDTLKYKFVVADCIVSHLSPISQKMNEFMTDPMYLEEILRIGAKKAREIAENTMQEVRSKLGIRFTNAHEHKLNVAVH